MKLALLGTGMIVKEVLPVLTEVEGIDLVGILSTPRSIETARDLAVKYGMSLATSDFEEILQHPEIDTVYVGTPNHTHFDYAKAALLAGKHVICEKPFTLNLAEFKELRALAEERQLFLLEAITNQYLGNFTYLKENLPQLGQLKIVSCNYSQYSSRYDAFKRGEIAPAFDPKKGGGALRDLNIYNIHLLVGLFGKPNQVTYLPNIERGVDTSGILVLDYGNFKATSIAAKDCSADIRSTIQGDEGSLTILGPTNSLPQVSLKLNGQEEISGDYNSPHHRMYEEFVAFETILSQQDKTALKAALDQSQLVMEVLEEAVTSMG
ncbi:Gfo/Idh/MocA family protein [Streptococcus loxodontisalivarius]|uniref:Dehydrogenase n=1 Tax=Streptococcus loxodontisalivarius TaxID=1349415 RepID=A0ABS2PT14_9STRE|nr:Gfo/Idh/MocA family oxidoreductase [Streptococcus loxodontisalivarius]MBM7643076.1 putative dehydrogenase [Streptococcus loxodontisalivarius]